MKISWESILTIEPKFILSVEFHIDIILEYVKYGFVWHSKIILE